MNDVGDAPQRGTEVGVRAYVALGDLTPMDVVVHMVSGRVDHNDRIVNPQVTTLAAAESYEGHRWRYEATVTLDATGPFGYTVRVLPQYAGLADPAELGLQATPRVTSSEDTDSAFAPIF